MGVISIRLNKDEEKVLRKLADVKKFEAKERKGKVSFFTAEDILKT